MFAGFSLASMALKMGVSQRALKFGLIAAAIVAAVIALGVAKCSYDRSVVNSANANQNAANSKADRKADTQAGVQRRADDSRLETETHQLEKVTTDAQTDLDRRLARQRLLRCQQDARAHGRKPSTCDRPNVPGRAAGAHR